MHSIAGLAPEGLGQFLLALGRADARVGQLLCIQLGQLAARAQVALPMAQQRVEAQGVQGMGMCVLRERGVRAVHGVLLSRDKVWQSMISPMVVEEQIQTGGIVQGQCLLPGNCTARQGDDCSR
ncbi:conserved protein of unknown function [Ectopseudomonas oleovorans]|uniref:Uncharacterized protein n=1 Tax=Ectopseudomonas oleovorans TaxID=301 RepID=A0A653B3C3_ECTOL|nr:conserved protein of unknown function [Pseudomonas oleovorans]